MNHAQWRSSGSPFKIAQPIYDLARILRRYGYTVGTIGNRAHLMARTPEDHVPYGVTGWPKPHPYPWVLACDIMPPPKGKGLPTLAQLGAQIVADRKAGLADIAWLKYINWTTDAGKCVNESWKPNHKVRSSNDVGHIHLSARSDFTRVTSAYDPVARFRARSKPAPKTPKPVTPAFPGRVIRLSKPLTRGKDVKTWQDRMKVLGYGITADGVFGPQSEAVLKKFQRDRKLTADGVLGPVSWRKAWA